MSNFKFPLSELGVASFADVAITAERWKEVDNLEEHRQTGIVVKSWLPEYRNRIVVKGRE